MLNIMLNYLYLILFVQEVAEQARKMESKSAFSKFVSELRSTFSTDPSIHLAKCFNFHFGIYTPA